ncbi:Cu2+-exporting ATPase [Fulvimarina manganoxydans]|uniref:Cu2+-exporting ATPase n=1 Tax=Fulvimarina manganoxydans TaxID=937218 RepID=A0A1W2AZL9_9HYPH|nr:heavy metal translocating P-type ATPase [Fulvimarina manganoxydans]SMC65912.1 Cu2+-exporting ATPase [Fulvimarina manganoxydans]
MSCCGGDLAGACVEAVGDPDRLRRAEELRHAGRELPDGGTEFVLSAPSIHCGQCIVAIEDQLAKLSGIENVRVNLTLKRVTITTSPDFEEPIVLLETLDRLGYPATPVDLGDLDDLAKGQRSRELLKALAVAGFASANVMLLSVSVWSGADAATRDFFHLVSALIALPAVGYSGRVFFRSALKALSAGRLNMDVPIALAILLALAMSLYESLSGGETAYFDAALTLTFFLLIGRFLDEAMRERARSAVTALARLVSKGANVVEADGRIRYRPLDEIQPGMRLRLAAGDRLAVDARVLSGEAMIDRSLVTGESAPMLAALGTRLEAGVLNLSAPIEVEATSDAGTSFLAETQRMMEAAEVGRGRYVRIADRMARIYAPAVHLLSLVTFLGWVVITGDWYAAVYAAISVLIITCPCALGLAVPVVHVVAAGRLFEGGVMMKDGSGLERLAKISHAVFDKTGTLTTGTPRVDATTISDKDVPLALSLAAASTHPAARAVAAHYAGRSGAAIEALREEPGCGMEGTIGGMGRRLRLGRPDWVGEIADVDPRSAATLEGVAFAIEGHPIAHVTLTETLRPGAEAIVQALGKLSLSAELLSGDAERPVYRLATRLGLPAKARRAPSDKIGRIRALQEAGERVLMVGDGLNDAPSLAAGDVSMAPASACDVGRLAADFVLTQNDLSAIPETIEVARKAERLVTQNFGLAIAYNCVAVPLAMAGIVTPLIAAIAMSASSILVVANSLRLARRPSFRSKKQEPATPAFLAPEVFG